MRKNNQSNDKYSQSQSEKDIAINQQLNELKSYLSSKDYKKVQKQLRCKTQKNKQEYLKQQLGEVAKSSKLFIQPKDGSVVQFAATGYASNPNGSPDADPAVLNIMVDHLTGALKSLDFIEEAKNDYKGPFNDTIDAKCKKDKRYHVDIKAQIKANNLSSLHQYKHDLCQAFGNGCDKVGKKLKKCDKEAAIFISVICSLIFLLGVVSYTYVFRAHQRSSNTETDADKREGLLTEQEQKAAEPSPTTTSDKATISVAQNPNWLKLDRDEQLEPSEEDNRSSPFNRSTITDAHL